ncbi:MAG: hypothetical protein ACREMA_20255, partial [Longimicrobiales bacterium]
MTAQTAETFLRAAAGILVGAVYGLMCVGPALIFAQVEGEGHFAHLLLALGISLIIQSAGLIAFGSIPVWVRTPLSAS